MSICSSQILNLGDDLKNPNDEWMNQRTSMGTTIMAAEFDGGVILAADSRTSAGVLVVNNISDKITKVTDNVYCLRAGTTADTQCIADVINYYMSVYEMETDEPALVGVVANSFRNMCYKYRDQLRASILVAGWDKRAGGQVYAVPSGGQLVKQSLVFGGSGSVYVTGYLDAHYKKNMPKEECAKLLTNAIALAMSRDNKSGGVIRLAIITKDGVERRVLDGDNIPKFK